MNRKKIFIGIPCYDTVAPEILEDYMRFAYSLGRRYGEYDFFLGIKTKSEQFRARNEIVKAALDVGVDYLLQIDDDMIIDYEETQFPTNKYGFLKTLINHIENDEKIGLIGVLYYERGNLCRPVLMKKITPTNYEWLTDDEIQGKMQSVDVQGGGCMLINMKVFDWIEGPTYFEPEHIYGTDVQICRKVQDAGFKVCCDSSIEFGHLRSQRMIITSANRNKVLEMSKDKDDQAKMIIQYARIVNQYRNDIMEYLGIDEKMAAEAFYEAEDWQLKFPDYDARGDRDKYYAESSKVWLARQVSVNNPEKPNGMFKVVLESLGRDIKYKGLDFACGPSPIGFELVKMGHSLKFLDLDNSEFYKFLKWRINKYNLKAEYVDKLASIEDESLDFVLALDCIEHFDENDVKNIVGEFRRILKPGGILYCNFMSNVAFWYPEHVFMDKQKFMTWIVENKLFPMTHIQYIKQSSYFEE